MTRSAGTAAADSAPVCAVPTEQMSRNAKAMQARNSLRPTGSKRRGIVSSVGEVASVPQDTCPPTRRLMPRGPIGVDW